MGRPWLGSGSGSGSGLGLGLGLGLDWAPPPRPRLLVPAASKAADLAGLFGRAGSTYTGSFGADEGKTAYDAGAWLLASGATA